MLLTMSIIHVSLKCPCLLHHISQLTGSKKVGCQYTGQRNLCCLKHFAVHSKLLHNSKETSVQTLSLRHILILCSTGKENRVICSNKYSHDHLTMFKNINSDPKNLIFSKAFNTSFTDADNMDTSPTTITLKLLGNKTKWSYTTPHCCTFRILPFTKKKQKRYNIALNTPY